MSVSLEITGTKVIGTCYALTPEPAKLTVYALEGTLTGKQLKLAESDPEEPDPMARIVATLSPMSSKSPLTTVVGSWRAVKDAAKPSPVSLTEEPLGTPPAIIRELSLDRKSRKPRYEYGIAYPQIVGKQPSDYVWVNSRLNQIAAGQARDMVKLARELDDGSDPTQMAPNSLYASYEVVEFTPQFLSVRFVQSWYTGGVHPSSSSVTYNFDLTAKRELKLDDLWPPGTPYLRPLALSAIAALCADPAADYSMVTAGASTHASNYKNWNLTRNGLIITFDPYQVGPYAAGTQQVYYPLAKLGDIRPNVIRLLHAN
jgi:hypothetical protein